VKKMIYTLPLALEHLWTLSVLKDELVLFRSGFYDFLHCQPDYLKSSVSTSRNTDFKIIV